MTKDEKIKELLASFLKKFCRHKDLWPSMDLQFKMARVGHFLLHGHWECRKCHKWIFLKCKEEYDSREGTKTINGIYQYKRICGKNIIVRLSIFQRFAALIAKVLAGDEK